MNLGTAQIIRANARNLPLADNSVDLVVTSPPYFALGVEKVAAPDPEQLDLFGETA